MDKRKLSKPVAVLQDSTERLRSRNDALAKRLELVKQGQATTKRPAWMVKTAVVEGGVLRLGKGGEGE